MSIELDVVYTCGLSSAMKVCALSVWRNWGAKRSINDLPVLFKDAALIESKKITVTVDVEVKKTDGSVMLPADAALSFEVMALSETEDGDWVRARGGYARMPVATLLKSATESGGPTFAVEYFNDWDDKGNRTPCGTLAVKAMRYVKLDSKLITFEKESVYSFTDTNADFLSKTITCSVARRIVNYTEEAAGKGTGMVPLRQVLARVQAPWFNSTAGVTCGPFYWVLPQRSSNNQEFFDRMLNSALLRHNRTEAWFKETIGNQFERIRADPLHYNPEFSECVRIVGDTLCMPSTALPYKADEVDVHKRLLHPVQPISALPTHDPASVKPSESWDQALIRNGGDCEDLALLIHLMYQGLRYGKWKSKSLSASAARVCALFVGAGTLTSVLAPSLGNDAKDVHKPDDGPTIINSKRDTDAEVGAHMFYMLLPRKRFAEQLKRTTTDLPASIDGEFTEAGWENLPTCILEGTGRLDPLQLPVSAYLKQSGAREREAAVEKERRRRLAVRHLLENCKITSMLQMTRAQRQLVRTPNARLGEFYMQPTSFVTFDVMDATNSLEFMWATVGERVPESDTTNVNALAPIGSKLGSHADSWSAVAALLDDNPATAPLPAQASAHSDAHKRRLHNAMNAPFARGVRSMHDALIGKKPGGGDAAAAVVAVSPKGEPIKYGIDIEDTLRTPSPAHVGILPTTSLDSVEARIGAETLRQLRPVALPGQFDALERLFAAEDVSIAAIGFEYSDGGKHADAAVSDLQHWAQSEMNSRNWPTLEDIDAKDHSLLTFFFAKKELYSPKDKTVSTKVLDALKSEYGAMKRSGIITHARVLVEEPLPRREQVVLQFVCDATRLTK